MGRGVIGGRGQEIATMDRERLFTENRKRWRKEIREKIKRRLVKDPDPELVNIAVECCVICSAKTHYWLMPENAPLCVGTECMGRYLENPRVYDPRGIYGSPTY